MSMNNEPKTVGRPCPWCGSAGYQNDYLVSTGHVACEDCGIELPVEAWDTLSDAAELARACEVLEEATPHGCGYTIEAYHRHAALLDWNTSEYPNDATVVREVDDAPTFAAALIALAKKVNDAT